MRRFSGVMAASRMSSMAVENCVPVGSPGTRNSWAIWRAGGCSARAIGISVTEPAMRNRQIR